MWRDTRNLTSDVAGEYRFRDVRRSSVDRRQGILSCYSALWYYHDVYTGIAGGV